MTNAHAAIANSDDFFAILIILIAVSISIVQRISGILARPNCLLLWKQPDHNAIASYYIHKRKLSS